MARRRSHSSALLSVLLALSTLLTFSSCGQSPDQASSTPASGPAAASQGESTGTPPEKIVVLKSIFPGDAPKSLDRVMSAVNKKLGQDIGVNLEFTWAPWDQYYNKVQMAIAAGEEIDWFWGGSSDVSVYAAKKIIAPIDQYMDQYGKKIYANISSDLFSTMKINDKLYGLPSTGNAPLTDVYNVLSYREDLRVKYNIPKLGTIESLETYFQTIKDHEPEMIPLCSSQAAYAIMPAFGPERYLSGTNGAVAFRENDDGSVDLMRLQDAPAFLGSVKKAREWYKKGYIPTDILNIGDSQAKLNAGAAACKDGSALQSSEQQSAISANIPNAVLNDLPIKGADQRYMMGNGGNAVYLSPVSKNPEKVIQFWDWIFESQENYDLYCYGVKGTDYELVGDRIKYLDSDYSAFPGWMFKNLNYLRFNEAVTDEYIQSMRTWDKGSKTSALQGFTFNPEKVSTELAQVSSVFGSYSAALNSGSADPAQILPEFSEKMKAAGQDEILAEAKRQVEEFLKK